MLETYFVEGMPVVNSIYDDGGIAVGKTGDGEYSYRSNTDGKVYRYRTPDIFYVPNLADGKKNCIFKSMSSFEKSINYFNKLYISMFEGDISEDEFIIRANEMICPDSVGDNSPAKEYFYKMKEAFVGVLNARLKEFEAKKDFIASTCGNAKCDDLRSLNVYKKCADDFIKLLLNNGEITEEEAKIMKVSKFSSHCLNAYLSFGELFITHDVTEAVKVREKFRKKYSCGRVESFEEAELFIVYGYDFPKNEFYF
jgi:hypothetical protein